MSTTKGWCVESPTSAPGKPLAWFNAEDEREAREYAARKNGIVREMDCEVRPNPHAPGQSEGPAA